MGTNSNGMVLGNQPRDQPVTHIWGHIHCFLVNLVWMPPSTETLFYQQNRHYLAWGHFLRREAITPPPLNPGKVLGLLLPIEGFLSRYLQQAITYTFSEYCIHQAVDLGDQALDTNLK